MAINSDLMQEILLRIRAEGSSELDKAKQGVAQLQGAIKALGKDFSEGNIAAGQWVGAVGKLGPPLKQLNDFVRAASDETRGWTPEIVKLSAAAAKMAPEMLRLGLATKAYRDEQEELTKATSRVHPEIAKLTAAASAMAPEMLRLTLATEAHAAEIDAMAAAYSRAAASPLVRGMTAAAKEAAPEMQKLTLAMQAQGREAEQLAEKSARAADSPLVRGMAEAGREATASSRMVARLTAAVREQTQAQEELQARTQRAADSPLVRGMAEAGKAASASSRMIEGMTRAVHEQADAARKQAADADKQLAEDIARMSLRAQRQEAIAKQAHDAMMKYGFGKDDPFWSSGKIEGTYAQAKAYGAMKDRMEVLNKEHDRGHESAKRFSYGLLNVAHAFQDAQYGMGAVLNNIPLVVQAFGGGPGLAGTVMIAGVVIDQAMPKIKQFAREIGMIRDPALEGGRTVDALKEKINALVEKPWKVDLDYRSIEKGKAELSLLEGRLKAFEAAVAKQTPMQEKVGKAVLGAVSDFAGEEGEAGGGANLGRVVTEMAKLGGDSSMLAVEANRSPDMKRARELRAGVETTEGLIRRGVFQPDELDAIRMQMQKETGEAGSLEAKARVDANQRILADTIGAALKGNKDALDRLIGLLGRPEAQALMRGNVGLGIKPVDPKFMGMLREATPGAIDATEEFEQDAALIDQQLGESIAAMKRRRLARKQGTDREVSSLVSRKAKPLEGELSGDILRRIQAGDARGDIAVDLNAEVERRMGDVPNAREASARIARQLMETTFADVMAAKGPGIDDRAAAGNVLREQAAAAAAKGDRVPKDPVTGKPLSDQEQWRLKQMDDDLRDSMRDRDRAATPQGMQQAFRGRRLAQMQGLAGQVAQANPGMAEQQVMQVAGTANQLMAKGWGRNAALTQAILQLQRQTMQVMQMQQIQMNGFMGTVGQMRMQLRRMQPMQQRRNTLLPNPIPGRQR